VLGEDIELALQLPSEPARVHADPTQLEQILMNLAVNARDAMPRGGSLVIKIRIAELEGDIVGDHVSVAPGPYVVLAVTDTGTGMDAATCERIFEPFFTTKEPGKGTGLGLSTVFAIVAKSGGVVVVESEPGRGTTFKVALPRCDAERTELGAPVPAPPTLLGSETILLVEDDEQVRGIVRAILRRQGYLVIEAANGAEAALINEQHDGTIHLLLTDVIMPRMGGRELAEQIVARRPDTRVIYFSGYNEDAILQHGVLDSGIDFLQKPVTPEVLKRKIRDVLDRR
jgi:CheY-like chemotaxis protein